MQLRTGLLPLLRNIDSIPPKPPAKVPPLSVGGLGGLDARVTPTYARVQPRAPRAGRESCGSLLPPALPLQSSGDETHLPYVL